MKKDLGLNFGITVGIKLQMKIKEQLNGFQIQKILKKQIQYILVLKIPQMKNSIM